jgi:hypothetical protein
MYRTDRAFECSEKDRDRPWEGFATFIQGMAPSHSNHCFSA